MNRCEGLVLGRLKNGLPALVFLAGLMGSSCIAQPVPPPDVESIRLDPGAPVTPFPHFWEKMFGSGRAVLALRESYRRDLETVRRATDFEYIRFHGIFDDDMGVYDEDAKGNPIYNFSYVDQVYDGLLVHHIRPFVELGFMPKKLAAEPVLHPFWYKPSPSPPKDYAKWDALITAFARHLIDRYGLGEVSQWYFEVWNEPNIDFWAGDPKQATYFDLYDHTARALKAVSAKLRVGGPATAQAAWANTFIRHVTEAQVPADFVSTHVYGNDSVQDVFGGGDPISREDMVCRAVKKVHDQIKSSARPDLALIWSEFNASYKNEPAITDAPYMGPWLADTIEQCAGLVDVMSYWSFSDVFDEQGVVRQPFYSGFGLIAEGGIPKASYNAFLLLHKLGGQRVSVPSRSALVTKREDGSWAIALWNLAPEGSTNTAKHFVVQLPPGSRDRRVLASSVDEVHGNVLPLYKQMGSPRYPTDNQLQELIQAAHLAPPQRLQVKDGAVSVDVSSSGLVLLEIR
jgi:xylan 1,4-beta-xylosidase